ncbi:hypothetical protein KKE60_04835 [Patescibacteria group bacterium]|nr:hypothetical protein [Patescibacteria group bacterium]
MGWKEILALAYLIGLDIILWFIAIRWTIRYWRKQNNQNSSANYSPEYTRVFHAEVIDLNDSPDNKGYQGKKKEYLRSPSQILVTLIGHRRGIIEWLKRLGNQKQIKP